MGIELENYVKIEVGKYALDSIKRLNNMFDLTFNIDCDDNSYVIGSELYLEKDGSLYSIGEYELEEIYDIIGFEHNELVLKHYLNVNDVYPNGKEYKTDVKDVYFLKFWNVY